MKKAAAIILALSLLGCGAERQAAPEEKRSLYTSFTVYDGEGNLVQKGERTYDDQDRLLCQITKDQDGNLVSEESYVYNVDGSSKLTDRNEKWVLAEQEFDSDGNMTRYGYQDDDEWMEETFTYEKDDAGRIIWRIGSDGYRTAYEYDVNGNPVSVTYYEDDVVYAKETIENTYDSSGALQKTISRQGESSAEREYNSFGEVTKETFRDTGYERVVEYTYDNAGNLISVVVYENYPNKIGTKTEYKYEKD